MSDKFKEVNDKINKLVLALKNGQINLNTIKDKLNKDQCAVLMHKFAKIGESELMEQMIILGADINYKMPEENLHFINIIESIIVSYYDNSEGFNKSIKIVSKYKPEKKIQRYIYCLLFRENRNFELLPEFSKKFIKSCKII